MSVARITGSLPVSRIPRCLVRGTVAGRLTLGPVSGAGNTRLGSTRWIIAHMIASYGIRPTSHPITLPRTSHLVTTNQNIRPITHNPTTRLTTASRRTRRVTSRLRGAG